MSRYVLFVLLSLLFLSAVYAVDVDVEAEALEAEGLESEALLRDMEEFNQQVENTEAAKEETDQALLEVHTEEGFFPHPYASLHAAAPPYPYYGNPWGSFPAGLRWGGYTPYAASGWWPYSSHPSVLRSLGVDAHLFPHMWHVSETDLKGGYNIHGLRSGGAFPYLHPGLGKDISWLSGGHGDDDHDSSDAGLLEHASEAATEADEEVLKAEEAIEEDIQEISALEMDAEGGDGDGDGDEKPDHPTYVLPYPPILPGHYTPLFNPYTNVNPLSTPFANYAAQPGAHPGVAAAAAAHAGALASANGRVAGHAGGYPYYPFAARHPIVAQQLQGNNVPFVGYPGWIHPLNLNSAAVGDNEPEEFPQFVELESSSSESEEMGCVGCSYD